ncbi:MAG: thioesterase family protein [Pseudomonadota bacterium]
MTDPAPTVETSPLFRSSLMRVEPDWLDYNDHLNMAFYNVLFDRAVDEMMLSLGLGPDYLKATGNSFFTAETHVTYLNEITAHDPVHVDIRVLDADTKRLHVFEELYHAETGMLSATLEQMLLHVDMSAKRVAPWPDAVTDQLHTLKSVHADLPRPPQIGSFIGIRRKR